ARASQPWAGGHNPFRIVLPEFRVCFGFRISNFHFPFHVSRITHHQLQSGVSILTVLGMRLFFALLTLSASVLAASATNWPHWRGPRFDGSTDEKNLPDDFSKTQNLAWSSPLPGVSAGTPIIWGDRVFVSSADDKAKGM